MALSAWLGQIYPAASMATSRAPKTSRRQQAASGNKQAPPSVPANPIGKSNLFFAAQKMCGVLHGAIYCFNVSGPADLITEVLCQVSLTVNAISQLEDKWYDMMQSLTYRGGQYGDWTVSARTYLNVKHYKQWGNKQFSSFCNILSAFRVQVSENSEVCINRNVHSCPLIIFKDTSTQRHFEPWHYHEHY